MNSVDTLDSIGLKPAKIDKHGPAYRREDVTAAIARMVQSNTYFPKRFKAMNKQITDGQAEMETATASFQKAADELLAAESNLANGAKKTSGSVRDSVSKLADGLARMEKTANFDRLERYVLLLERAASAIQTLADIEESGKLEKISSALK